MKRLPKHERETIITFSAEDVHADVYTYEPRWITHFNKLKVEPYLVNGYGGHSYSVPIAWIRKPLPPRSSRS